MVQRELEGKPLKVDCEEILVYNCLSCVGVDVTVFDSNPYRIYGTRIECVITS
jgi:hypothetical protein